MTDRREGSGPTPAVLPASTGGGLGYSLSKAAQLWRAEAGIALRPSALTVPQFLVVMELYRPARHDWPAPLQSHVATRLGMDANTASQIVRGLETRGVLSRNAHPTDRRALILRLTAYGLELARTSSATVRSLNDSYFGAIAPEQREALTGLLDTLIAHSRARLTENDS